MSTLSNLRGGVPLWVSGTTYPEYQVVRSPADKQLYLRITAAGSGATDPSADATNYAPEGARPIKSIQRGTILLNGTTSATATITAVVTTKSELRFLGATSGGVSATDNTCRVVLTDSTTITAARAGSSNTANVSWELTEWY